MPAIAQNPLWKPKPLFGADWISAPSSAASYQRQPRMDYLTPQFFGNQTQAPIEAPVTPFFQQQNQLLNQLNAPAQKITAPTTPMPAPAPVPTPTPLLNKKILSPEDVPDPWNWGWTGSAETGGWTRQKPLGTPEPVPVPTKDEEQEPYPGGPMTFPKFEDLPSTPGEQYWSGGDLGHMITVGSYEDRAYRARLQGLPPPPKTESQLATDKWYRDYDLKDPRPIGWGTDRDWNDWENRRDAAWRLAKSQNPLLVDYS